MTNEHEMDLVRRWQDHRDRAALDELVRSQLKYVRQLSWKLARGDEDVFAAGCVGLLRAIGKFDTASGNALVTYASHWIRQAMRVQVEMSRSMVIVTRSSLVYSAIKDGRTSDADLEEIAKRNNRTVGCLRVMIARLRNNDLSLNAKMPDSGEGEPLEWISGLADRRDQFQEIEERDEFEHRSRVLTLALDGLNDQERMVIRRRWLGDEVETFDEIGADLGVTRQRIQQVESRAMGKLRAAVGSIAQVADASRPPAQAPD